jgi:hypothetical protein
MPDTDRMEDLRKRAKTLLLGNPNYFGNLAELKIEGLPQPVLQIVGNTAYEELTCLGLNPDTRVLTAVVRIKRPSGYGGGPCTPGAREYVRFYLDWDDGAGWTDHGIASFNIHDLGFKDPLCYAVSIDLKAKRTSCCDDKPVLPKVRAILSFNIEPPPNMPNWHPVWGNRLERVVQIDPRSAFICKFGDLIGQRGAVKIDPDILKKLKLVIEEAPVPPKPVVGLAQLVEKIERSDTEGLARAVQPVIATLAADKTDLAAWETVQGLKALKIDISKILDLVAEAKFNTSFEELHCVGLDRDMSTLHGIVQVKRSSGYSGGLCSAGSRQYIAFYLDFGDGAGWQYQGTTWVVTHDVPGIPRGGLWYQAQLPVNLDKHRKEWCATGRARIRGILSWNAPPTPNDPDFVATWGDWEECGIEVKPWPKGVVPGQLTPVLEAIGRMPVAQIDAAGFAHGDSVGATFSAQESPFGGAILFSGVIAFPSSNNLEYRVMVKGPGDAVFKPWTQTFTVAVTTVIGGSISFANVAQVANGDWFSYIPQAGPAVFKSVAENLLARFTATADGFHEVFLQVREAGSAVILASSTVEAFFVDNKTPVVDVEITSGGGNCSKFPVGTVLSGTYSMTETHARSLTISVTPAAEAAGGHLAFVTVAPAAPLPPALPGPTASNSLTYPLRLTTDGASGTWDLDTTGMKPCGYNIRIRGVDRTIVNSSGNSWEGNDIEGFCLE